jgi:hypothetical protein
MAAVTVEQRNALLVVGNATTPQHLWKKRVEISTRRAVVNRGWVKRDMDTGDLRLTKSGIQAAGLG